MAEWYTVAGAVADVKVVSQTQVADVEAVSLYTKPSGIYMIVLVPIGAWQSGGANAYLYPPAFLTEQIMTFQFGPDLPTTLKVTSAQYVQRQDQSGLLAGFMDFTVTYLPDNTIGLPFQATAPVAMTSLASIAAFGVAVNGFTPLDLIQAVGQRLYDESRA